MSRRSWVRTVGVCGLTAMLIAGCSGGSRASPSSSISSASGPSASGALSSAASTVSSTLSANSAPAGASVSPTVAGSSAAQGPSLPATPAGAQATWLLGRLDRLPIPDAELTAHFDPAFLAAVPAVELNTTLKQLQGLRVTAIVTSTPTAVVATTQVGSTTLQLSLAVGADGRITGLRLVPTGAASGTATASTSAPPAASWAQVDAALKAVIPTARLLVAQVDGDSCRTTHGLDATTAAPLGSAFKLYVLDALARAIAAGKVSWTQKLTVTDAVKSLPSGELQNAAAGTTVTVQQAAILMISISDNTAADMLLGLVGRAAVQQAMTASAMADPARNIPFPATRELFVLKLSDYPQRANRYLGTDTAGRTALLSQTHTVALSDLDLAAWTSPRDIDRLEWFASPADICRVYASLGDLARAPGLAPLSQILSVNSGGIPLSRNTFPRIWFKGGSEPGVLTLNYRVMTASGRTYVASLLTENPTAAIPASATADLLTILAGALELAAQGS